VARLIKTEKEVEGRYTEQWVVVEGDDEALDQWPQGPGAVVGQPAPRQDGHQRARGQAQYTGDLQVPGMLHAAVLRSPVAHARVKKLDLSAALELPGVLGAIGPDDCHVLQTEPGFHGAPIAAGTLASASFMSAASSTTRRAGGSVCSVIAKSMDDTSSEAGRVPPPRRAGPSTSGAGSGR